MSLFIARANCCSFFKLNQHYKILLRPLKNYSDETFTEKLRSIKYPGYSNFTCVTNVYENLISKLLFSVDSQR